MSIFKIIRLLIYPFKRILGFLYTQEVKRKCAKYGANLSINNRCQAGKNVYLGKNVNFNGIKIKGGGKVKIGDNFHSGVECLIIPRFHNYDHGQAIPYDNSYIEKDVVIKDNVWIGDRVIILGGVEIGEGAIIQAGSCVVRDIPDYAIAGGHPASTFKYRNIEHYKKLKQEEAFH